MSKHVWLNILWGVLAVGLWVYQVFWPLLWVPIVGKFWGAIILYALDAIILGFAIRATYKGYGRQENSTH
ncbi:hypothetical protein FC83_GL002891 [Agrilactobacillus composti DSM 18527 = JCM 14202]|uniref:Uncharacterized protein n=1 Tax=Agrilactobacillus composti DSM 18527 = JCM 14202 TaxID=1423734 RepID=X0PFI1_9LACO|nr:hypothetical protein [Agrilactobacillus composti]KRM33324.1 hypothetical protein FC83_GL002891 [Agrilactobacillus composti DSM 18527 = JCM 14202]GAF40699.1 hypothetical protein JCM14202_2605 [Agrilactobacillus composti DSM 18527 = JCM 14202]